MTATDHVGPKQVSLVQVAQDEKGKGVVRGEASIAVLSNSSKCAEQGAPQRPLLPGQDAVRNNVEETFMITIEYGGCEMLFKVKGRHTVSRVLGSACERFGIGEKDVPRYEVHSFSRSG